MMVHPLRIYFVLLLISVTYLIGSEAALGDTLDVVVNGEKMKVKDGRRNPDSSEPLTLIESSAVPNYHQPSSSSSSSNYQPNSGPPQAWPMWPFPAMPPFQWWNPWGGFGMPINNNNNKNNNNNNEGSSSSSNSDDDKKSQKGRLGK